VVTAERAAQIHVVSQNAANRVRARSHLIPFAVRVQPGYQPSAVHYLIASYLERIDRRDITRLIVEIPPRHGKTNLISELFPAWYLGRHPDQRIIGTSYAGGLANRISRRARNVLDSPLWPFPDVGIARDLGAVQSWDLAGHRGGYIAAGVGGGIGGHGAHVLLIDDPFKNAMEAESHTVRESVWEWYTSTAYTRLMEDSAVIIVSTRWHEDDLIGRILRSQDADRWTVIHLPAVAEDDDDLLGRAPGEPLWPERYPAESLAVIKNVVGARYWSALYQQRPSPAEGGILPRAGWTFWHPPGRPLPPVSVRMLDGSHHLCPVRELPERMDRTDQSWDLAFRDGVESTAMGHGVEGEGGSFVVGQVWSQSGADLYLRSQLRARLGFVGTISAIRSLREQWPNTGATYVENKANGPAVIQSLRRQIPGIIPVEPEGGKAARAVAVSPNIESGNVMLPHPDIAPWVWDLIEEGATFPNGTYTDQIDALTQAVNKMLGEGNRFVEVADQDALDAYRRMMTGR